MNRFGSIAKFDLGIYNLVLFACLDLVAWICYIGFAYLVIHKGNFYETRRWKAAILLAGIGSVAFAAIWLYAAITPILSVASSQNTYETSGQIFEEVLGALLVAWVSMLLLTLVTHGCLRSSGGDAFLDKVWKDPNRGPKSTVQDL